MSEYLKKIKQLNKINITAICKELNINRSNLINGRSTEKNEKEVYQKIVEHYKNIIK